eukprot:CAMPEP_0181098304 /NCGR_PEP_ID=MMETSP1071-20121207/12054_1 /TAXON_ID=35127 /ORGANISM="Thalassiosira sp., Strain NH16" /LENGTH=536 /DNA_ID=CAMNT_0023180889 /DNA_START=170 /DNA_END=1780 /DNA_ORIENTATION=+
MKLLNTILPTLLSGTCLLKPVIAQLTLGSAGNDCPSGYTKITSELGCSVANNQLNLSYGFVDTEDDNAWPGGCYHCDNVAGCADGTWLNYADPGAANGGATPICAEPGWEDGVGGVDTLFVGDSDIALWDTNANFPGSINVGVGGYTCDDVNSDIDAHLATYKPNKVVIVCGENDLTGQSTASEKFGDFQVVINKITASGATALYLGTKPEPSTTSLWEKYQRYDAMIFDYANTLATDASTVPVPLTVIDVHAAFVDLGNPNALYDSDRLHLSSDGYEYWNTWTTTALDNSANGCVRWKNSVCDVTDDTTTTTNTTTANSTATSAATTTGMPIICPMIYKPVCASDGRVYSNACEAEAEGHEVEYEIESPDENLKPLSACTVTKPDDLTASVETIAAATTAVASTAAPAVVTTADVTTVAATIAAMTTDVVATDAPDATTVAATAAAVIADPDATTVAATIGASNDTTGAGMVTTVTGSTAAAIATTAATTAVTTVISETDGTSDAEGLPRDDSGAAGVRAAGAAASLMLATMLLI